MPDVIYNLKLIISMMENEVLKASKERRSIRRYSCAHLRKMNAEAMGVESDPYYGAPTIVIVLAREDDPNNIKDGSLILGNMMLAAHSIGLSSCWINREDVMFASEQGKQLMKDWNLPEGLIGVGALSLGYASAHPHTVKPRKEDYYRIIK